MCDRRSRITLGYKLSRFDFTRCAPVLILIASYKKNSIFKKNSTLFTTNKLKEQLKRTRFPIHVWTVMYDPWCMTIGLWPRSSQTTATFNSFFVHAWTAIPKWLSPTSQRGKKKKESNIDQGRITSENVQSKHLYYLLICSYIFCLTFYYYLLVRCRQMSNQVNKTLLPSLRL